MGKDVQFRLRLDPRHRQEWIKIKKIASKIGAKKLLEKLNDSSLTLLPEWMNESYLSELNNMNPDDFERLVMRQDAFIRVEDLEDSGYRVVNAFSHEIRTIEDLIDYHGIDVDVWEPDRVITNMWNQGSKIPMEFGGGICKVQLHQIKATFKKKLDAVTADIRKYLELQHKEHPVHITTNDAGFETYLVLGCVHVPFHNKMVWNAIMNYICDNKKHINGIILNGDFLDMKSLSSHDERKRMPDGFDLGYEYREGYKAILDLKRAFGKYWPNIRKCYNWGNHEDRWQKHISISENAKYGAALQHPADALGLEDEGFEIQLDWKNGYVKLGLGLEVFHGKYTGKNSGSQHLMNTEGVSVLYNHTHTMGEYFHGGQVAYNCGWLGDRNSEGFRYSDRFAMMKWQLGFAEVTIDDHGDHYVNKVKCHESGFFKDGKSY